MKTDAQIAREAIPQDIVEIAKKLHYTDKDIDSFGHFKAKVPIENSDNKGKLILVTAMNPTPLGEGKTTISIGLADAISSLGKSVCLALREPSLGPVFGIKGGACGGGYSQVIPMEDINLHFNGDFHAITAANNLLCALIDNHIYQGNHLDIQQVIFKRCLDVNDRVLRQITIAQGSKFNGVERQDGFTITAASEIMAILCLSSSLKDLYERISNIVIGYNSKGEEVYAKDLHAQDSLCVLLKEAIRPNLVQTLEGTPALIHGGPFANIAHGCNSVIATNTALSRADYVVTEAGFGAELGAEKFLDIVCRKENLSPSCIVLVVSLRSIKYNGGIAKEETQLENIDALKNGFCNVQKHIQNLQKFNQKVVVAINQFPTDTQNEIDVVSSLCKDYGAKAVVSSAFINGSSGAKDLAKAVLETCDLGENKIHFAYDLTDSIQEKIEKIAKNIYGASEITFSEKAQQVLEKLQKNRAYDDYAVCIAKTQYSFSTNDKALGAPNGFTFEIQDLELRNGAKFIVVIAGKILLMPGLGASPNTDRITINTENGQVDGLM